MHFTTFATTIFFAGAVPLAFAQDLASVDLSSDNAQCESQEIVDTCVSMMQRYLQKCSSDNWDCKCSGYANMANCYVNCPDSAAYIAAQSSSASSCATANAYDVGNTVVPDAWKTMDFSNNHVHAAATKTAEKLVTTPTSSFGLNGQKGSTQPSNGAASLTSVNGRGSWLALVGLGVGALF
ncbi:Uncharacterized protein PECH_001304 [Penicillium ucsense]|uniref:GPI anchored serine-threonine rich protein n=1 Tax=Penicillium ucsense TaxID=2839758 RepID=A0A8J8WFQ0_9EURO|nr:Uncharacterized protein PECM_002400 [Penicillium ucsense]KAF7732994.1 Uncharacterized protein PECH_001304 [Penicillium ucsense]